MSVARQDLIVLLLLATSSRQQVCNYLASVRPVTVKNSKHGKPVVCLS